MAAVLACGPGSALSHLTAAALWGLAETGSAVEVTVPRDRNPRRNGVCVHRRLLDPEDTTAEGGIPVTTPARTLLDLATVLSPARLEAAVNQADKLDRIDPESLRAAIAERCGESGLPALRRILDPQAFARTDSELERRFLRLVGEADLPKPETQAPVSGFRVDFLWRDSRLVVETDGLRYHRTAADQAKDRRRDQVLAAAGYTVLRFTYAQVVERPSEVAATLAAVVARAAYSSSNSRAQPLMQ